MGGDGNMNMIDIRCRPSSTKSSFVPKQNGLIPSVMQNAIRNWSSSFHALATQLNHMKSRRLHSLTKPHQIQEASLSEVSRAVTGFALPGWLALTNIRALQASEGSDHEG